RRGADGRASEVDVDADPRDRSDLVAHHGTAGACADPRRRRTSLHRAVQGTRRRARTRDRQTRPAVGAAPGVRQHHTRRRRVDHRRVHIGLPRHGRPRDLLGLDARPSQLVGCGHRRSVVVPAAARRDDRARRAVVHARWARAGDRAEPASEGGPVTSPPPLLELRNLGVTYRAAAGDVHAVRGVDKGERLGIAGQSGSGKSTVAASVLRLLPKSATVTGEVLLDGENVADMRWGRLRAVRWSEAAVVFQGAMHALNPVQRIGRQIAEPIRLHGTVAGDAADPSEAPGESGAPAGHTAPSEAEVDARVRELLAQVDLPPSKARSYPHELSGGQKQRVMIAMALACRPRLLIADEPTTALDVVVQAQVLDLLGGLVAEQGIGLMFITHDLSVLASTCRRIAVMYRGEVVESGAAKDV